MNDFDELLDDVLRGYANPPAPLRLEESVVARLREERKRGSGSLRPWIGIAASIAVVLGTWMLVLNRPAPMAHEQAVVQHADEPLITHNNVAAADVKGAGPEHVRRPVRMAALTIDPISIEPIEIPPIRRQISPRNQ